MLHTFEPKRLRNSRSFVFGLLFIALVGLTGAIFDANRAVLAAPDGPTNTLPPGATIPPGTLPPVDGPILSGLINVLHLAPFDAVLANTAVVVCKDADNSLVAGPLLYSEQSGYLELFIGEYDWYLAAAGAGCGSAPLLDFAPFNMLGGSKLSLIVYGGANGFDVTSVLIVEVLGQDSHLLPLVRNEEQP